DDPHIHAGANCMIEEDRVHCLSHRLITAEREGNIRKAARDMSMGQFLTNHGSGFDEGAAIVVMLLDTCCDCKDIRIENNVFGWYADLVDQQMISALADLKLSVCR